MICVIFAHPYPGRSRAGRILLEGIRDLPGIDIRSLYDLYPDFDIDVDAEQQALIRARLVVWLHPIFWYSVPSLLKHWFDQVLAYGWAYGPGGDALRGKHGLWVATTGADEAAYGPEGAHQRPFEDFVAPVEQTVRYCSMEWEAPEILHGAQLAAEEVLSARAGRLRARLEAWAAPAGEPQND